jgi:2-polyprenyl-3-methyl-5-hydroxy-6-metoxy-1,4-benzoquinol methylase
LITKEEAVLAYRLMLGREPENEDVINNLCQNTHTHVALREVFLKSPEFQQRMGEMFNQPQSITHRHPFTLPKIPVETQVSKDTLQQMFERIYQEWDHLGQTEPYWSVVTQPQYYQAEFESHREQFYSSGNYSCQIFLASLRRCGINPASLQTCLEVGCGVGRVTKYLAAAFANLISSDISSQHLDLAKQHLQTEQIKNVELQHWETMRLIDQLPMVDAIYSVITLQHNPPPLMAWMLQSLLSKLRNGGVASIQIPTYCNGYFFEVERYLHSTSPDTLEMHFLPQQDVFKIVAEANCICLEVREDGMVGDEDKMLSNTFLIQKK